MTDRPKTLDEPFLLEEIRSFPRKYLKANGRLDSIRMRIDLGILTDEELKDTLLALYRLDLGVAHRVDERLARALLAKLVGAPVPITLVPPEEESSWLRAEMRCTACPGSQEAPAFEGGPVLPLCQNIERLERWESCMKFREHLFAASKVTLEDDLPDVATGDVVGAFEREVDVAIEKAKES